ncbi:hypothetical protein GGI20_003136 [Coemansia sp. BCRC 34301]|nr:hypothetical protein GGI20_003136 [Coemansia sp. BCRC 34301]
MATDTYRRIRSALDGPSDCSFVHWLLDESEGACLALECVLLTLSGGYSVPRPASAEQESVLSIYEKLADSLADPASQELARGLQDKYVLVGATLFDLAHAFGRTHPWRLHSLLASLCTNAPWLETEIEAASDLFMDQLVSFQDKYNSVSARPSIEVVCADIELQWSMSQSWLRLVAFCQLSTSALLHENRCIRELSRAYDVATALVLGLGVVANHAPSREAKSCSVLVRELKWQWSSLACCILQSLLANDSKQARANLYTSPASGCGVLLSILNDMHTVETKLIPFYNAPLLLDMEFRFGLRRVLTDASLTSEVLDQAQLDYIVISIDQLMDMTDPLYQSGLQGLQSRVSQAQGSLNGAAASASAGNGTMVGEGGSDIDAGLVLQIRELIPELGSGFIRACLDYYGTSAEAVVAAIFEGNLPPSLAEMDRSASHWTRPVSNVDTSPNISSGTLVSSAEEPVHLDVLSSRRNIFDNDEFDIFRHNSLDWSRVQQGKSKLRTNLGAPDSDFKSRIMEIAQRIEEDDEYDDTYDHAAQDITAGAIDAKNDIDASATAQHVPGHKSQGKTVSASKMEPDPIKPWEAMLTRLYVEDPALFERKRQTRNSPARADLCAQTGLTHEQIEGWCVMFRRNPRYQQIMDKQTASNSNRPSTREPQSASDVTNEQGSVKEGGRRRARAGSPKPAERSFRNKEKHKAKIGNHDRKKQHARKVRGTVPGEGGPPPPPPSL